MPLPDPKNFQIGDLNRQYKSMKRIGRCPYDSFEEYVHSLLPELPSNKLEETNFYDQCSKAFYDAFNSELTKRK